MAVPCGKVGASETGTLERGGGVKAPAPTMSPGKRVPGSVGLSESSPLSSRSSIRIARIRGASEGARLFSRDKRATTKATFASGFRGGIENPALRCATEYNPEFLLRKAWRTFENKAFPALPSPGWVFAMIVIWRRQSLQPGPALQSRPESKCGPSGVAFGGRPSGAV